VPLVDRAQAIRSPSTTVDSVDTERSGMPARSSATQSPISSRSRKDVAVGHRLLDLRVLGVERRHPLRSDAFKAAV
jgi:hypothetical protein